MLSRRALMAALASGCGLIRSARADMPQIEGCCLVGRNLDLSGLGAYGIIGTDADEAELIPTLGDPETEHRLGRALLRLAKVFEVRPECGFYNDWRGPNALAVETITASGVERKVLIGKNLFRETMAENPDGIAILAVCAHEFGHIAQYRTGMHERLKAGHRTVKPVELHADFLAGFYLGLRQAAYPDLRLWFAGKMIHDQGDNNFGSPGHHGTPEERTAAIEEGYRLGHANAVLFAQAMTAGEAFVRRLS